MIFLRKYRFDFTNLIWYIHGAYLSLMPVECLLLRIRLFFARAFRTHYSRLVMGLFFLLLLLAILAALPASAIHQAPYLSAKDIPSQSHPSLASDPQHSAVSSDPLIPLPVTGR